jgi:hypothetical protein
MTVAAALIGTSGGMTGTDAGMAARLSGWTGRPPDNGAPSSTLTVPMHDDAPQPAPAPPLHQIRRRYVALGLIVLALILLGALILLRQNNNPDDSGSSETFSPAPGSLIGAVSQIPTAISNDVGVTSPTARVNPPTPTRGGAVWRSSVAGGSVKPVVFFYGAEFTPYAAAERWPVVVALSRFGSFGQLGQAQSSGTEVFADTATFTFWQSTYSSRWITLRTVERYGAVNPTGASFLSLQKPDAAESAAVNAYDASANTFPLLDIANRYVLVGSAFSPAALSGLSQADIAGDLAYPTSPVTQAVLTAANEITASICTVTGQQPDQVCGMHGVLEADLHMGINPVG